MMKEQGHKHVTFWVIVVTICVLTALLAQSAIKNGGVNTTGTRGTSEYKTLKEVQKDTVMDLTIPSGIDTSNLLEIRSVMGQIIEIRAEHYVLKAALFVDVNADPLGLYDKSEIDKRYTVNNSDITYFRYRTGYEEYPNCTIVNWCNSNTALGIMFDEVLSEDSVLTLMELDANDLVAVTTEENTDTQVETEINWQTYEIANGEIVLNLPETESIIDWVDLDGYTILFLNKTRCLVVVYSDYSMDTNVFGGQGQIDIDEHTRLNYLLENEFESDTPEHRDYTKFLSNIQKIADSITRK